MLAIIDYGMGNLGSIQNMLKKVGARATITSDPAVIDAVAKIKCDPGSLAHELEKHGGGAGIASSIGR